MVGMSDVAENSILDLIFTAVVWANIADDGTSPTTIVAWALHTGDIGDSGNQETSEAAYGNYARVGPARTTGGHTITAESMSPQSNVDFPTGSSGGETVSHFSVGKTISGATDHWFSGTVTPNITTGNTITPTLTTATTVVLA